MRIEGLYIEGFGHYSAKSIGPFNSPVTVIFGPNEAGKSTLLAFIRAVLFGFPSRRSTYYPLSPEDSTVGVSHWWTAAATNTLWRGLAVLGEVRSA